MIQSFPTRERGLKLDGEIEDNGFLRRSPRGNVD